jgi:hypothetical protein
LFIAAPFGCLLVRGGRGSPALRYIKPEAASGKRSSCPPARTGAPD